MDDIKESVRLAAGKAAGSLSRASVKMCDADTAGQKGGGRSENRSDTGDIGYNDIPQLK